MSHLTLANLTTKLSKHEWNAPPGNPTCSRLLLTGIDGDRPHSALGDSESVALPPVRRQRQQVEDGDGAVGVEVGGAFAFTRYAVVVCVTAQAVGDVIVVGGVV